jgi:hypothetical protein
MGFIVTKMSDLTPPPVEVNFDINNNGVSYIDIETRKGYEDYFIDLDRLKDDSEILHWVKHLCQKNWMTTSKLQQFISNIEQYNKTLKESEEVECRS